MHCPPPAAPPLNTAAAAAPPAACRPSLRLQLLVLLPLALGAMAHSLPRLSVDLTHTTREPPRWLLGGCCPPAVASEGAG